MAGIVKIMARDPVVNRIQDNVRDTVNPALVDITRLQVRMASAEDRLGVLEEYVPPPIYTTATEPAASSGISGKTIVVKDAGQPSIIKMCVQNSAGGYEWVGIGQSS